MSTSVPSGHVSIFFCASVSSSTAMYLVPCHFLPMPILVFRLALLIPIYCDLSLSVSSLSAPVCFFASVSVSDFVYVCVCVCACGFLCSQHSVSVAFISVGGCLCLSVSTFNASAFNAFNPQEWLMVGVRGRELR